MGNQSINQFSDYPEYWKALNTVEINNFTEEYT